MDRYVGTKTIKAMPMDLGTYNTYRGWKIPENDDPSSAGYLVEYEDGYQSWSPEKTFRAAYQKDGNFNFGHALFLLNAGLKVYRTSWYGASASFLFLVQGSSFLVNREPLTSSLGLGTQVAYHAHIDICRPDNRIAVWNPTVEELLATDWALR